jgi:hypothetical protein
MHHEEIKVTTKVATLKIRQATLYDVENIVKLDRERWERVSGVSILTSKEIVHWLQQESPYFLVVEEHSEGSTRLVGYYVGLRILFTASTRSIDQFLQSKILSSQGYTEHNHDHHGNCLYGINVTSTNPRVALLIRSKLTALMKQDQLQFMVGVARLSGFASYLEYTKGCTMTEHTKATAYCLHELMRYENFIRTAVTPELEVSLAVPTHYDRVLRHHVADLPTQTLLATLPYLPSDRASAGWGALLMSHL